MNISTCRRRWGPFTNRARTRGVPRIFKQHVTGPVACAVPARWYRAAIDAHPELALPEETVKAPHARVNFGDVCAKAHAGQTRVVTIDGSEKFVIAPPEWLVRALDLHALPANAEKRFREEMAGEPQ